MEHSYLEGRGRAASGARKTVPWPCVLQRPEVGSEHLTDIRSPEHTGQLGTGRHCSHQAAEQVLKVWASDGTAPPQERRFLAPPRPMEPETLGVGPCRGCLGKPEDHALEQIFPTGEPQPDTGVPELGSLSHRGPGGVWADQSPRPTVPQPVCCTNMTSCL